MNDFEYLLIFGFSFAAIIAVLLVASVFLPKIPAVARAIVNFKEGRSGVSKDFKRFCDLVRPLL